MAKSFEIIMAGLISGIVALTTTFLGVGGTVIGAVLGAIVYQILSIVVKEPLENTTVRKVENEVVYILPLVLIAIILTIFIMSYFFIEFLTYYELLKSVTENNLLTIMGIGLIVMGIYPILQSKNIKKIYGTIVLILGTFLLIRGLMPYNSLLMEAYIQLTGQYDMISIFILLALSAIIIVIFSDSVTLYRGRKRNMDIPIISKDNDEFKTIHVDNYNTNNSSLDAINNEKKNIINEIKKDIIKPDEIKNIAIDVIKDINNPNIDNDIENLNATMDNDNMFNEKNMNNGNNNEHINNDKYNTGKINKDYAEHRAKSTIKSNKTSTMSRNQKFFKRK
ncbi:hypothetical protein [Methanobrevibacter cuticularis]|uniref:hypothetical protein n=1 Tax=Methanobrevibacter cuticularis TaxID=47311 RepID=UPI0008375824|nr:hypothetical protein [Methanobrevibacter cuticularis]